MVDISTVFWSKIRQIRLKRRGWRVVEGGAEGINRFLTGIST